MTRRAVVVADALGGGRYRVELPLDPAAGGRRPAAVTAHPVRAGGPAAMVESVAAPHGNARDRASIVVSVDHDVAAGALYEVADEHGVVRVALGGEPDQPKLGRGARRAGAPSDIDYRARDFDALRTMLLDRVATRAGGGLVVHPVAETTALVELVAYLGDTLSYTQDALATEAYLVTARRRVSAARHAELLDYRVDDGRSARAWVWFDVREETVLPAGTVLLTRTAGLPVVIDQAAAAAALGAGALAFATLREAHLVPDPLVAHLSRARHPGSRLRAGATVAVVAGAVRLRRGDLVVIGPEDDLAGAGHVVRLTDVRADADGTALRWDEADALPPGPPAGVANLRVRAGNVVLVEHGAPGPWRELPLPVAGKRYRPALPGGRPSFVADAHHAVPSAAEVVDPGPATTVAAVDVRDQHGFWLLRESLLDSGSLDRHFVVEVEEDGAARLRFGDGINGLAPAPGLRLSARQRTGSGAAGNVGPHAIVHVVGPAAAVTRVTNPSAAAGGADPEPLERIRLDAPKAFRVTGRTVDRADYVAAALAVPGVADAAARIARAGAGPVARVRVHGGSWSGDGPALARRVADTIRPRQPAGVGLDVRPAVALPVAVELDVVIRRGWSSTVVSAEIDDALRRTVLAPDRFRLGTPLHRSELVAVIARLPGVVDVTVRRFGWHPGTARPRPAREELLPPFGAVLRAANDVGTPAHGSVTYRLVEAA